MNDTPMHFAKRELQRMTNSRAVHIGLVTVGIIAGITGPFGTEDVMRLLPRMIYWVGVVALTFLTGTFVSSYFEALLNKHSAPFWISSGLCGGAIAAVVCVQVLVSTGRSLAFPHSPKITRRRLHSTFLCCRSLSTSPPI